MEVSVSGPDSLAVEAQVVALAVRDGTAPPGRLGERVRSLLDEDGFKAKAGDAVLLHLPADAGAERVAVGGLGPEIDADAVRTAAGGIARLVAPIGGTLAWMLDDSLPLPATEQARAVVDGLVLGGYDPGLRKTEGRKEAIEASSSSAATTPFSRRPSVPGSSRGGRIAPGISRTSRRTS